MNDPFTILRRQLHRQISHWEIAAAELSNLEQTASPQAWASLERYVGISLRRSLDEAVGQLVREARAVRALFEAARTPEGLDRVSRELTRLRDRYLRTETLVDYYGDAVNTRTNPALAANLRAFDVLAMRSMTQLLEPLGRPTPPVLTYLEKGLGASILKAGLRLWDGTTSAVATIKVTFHNRRRPTALIHETGHQMAHVLGWNDELAAVLRQLPGTVGEAWGAWASEVAADCFGFVHTGFASVAALGDVVAGEPAAVFRYLPDDPHPISYLRVLLGIEMCHRFFGPGPWDDLRYAWTGRYPLYLAPPSLRGLLEASLANLTRIAESCLLRPMQAFGGRPLAALLPPDRVSPRALAELEADAGAALFTSSRWLWGECVRLIGLTGMRFVTHPEESVRLAGLQDQLMDRLGRSVATIHTAASA